MDRYNWAGSFKINDQHYGGDNTVYIIAEIGSNHCGSLKRAKKLIACCADAGVNAVKFQSWQAHKLQNSKVVSKNGKLVDSKVIPVLVQYQLPEEWHSQLAQYCRKQGIDFLSTPFDI